MAVAGTNPKVEAYLANVEKWQDEFARLRMLILECGLTEEFKWGNPCYTAENRNIVLIHGFKNYCALLFFKGALLRDPQGILVQQTENVQAARQIRFAGLQEILAMEPTLKAYIQEAVAVENAGLAVDFKETTEFSMPEELQRKFTELPALQAAFEALTPGRQRAYLLHFSQPKQAKTREARIEKWVPQILEGKGLND